MWSFSMLMVGKTLWTFGGCASSNFYNTLSAINLDVSLSASNFYAHGTGISTAVAGVQCMFYCFNEL